MSYIVLLRNPLLLEAIKGGAGGDEHELSGHISWTEGGTKKHASITHGFDGRKQRSFQDGIKEYSDILKDHNKRPELKLSLLKKTKQGDDPKRRFFGDPHDELANSRAYIRVGPKHDGQHYSTKLISVNKEERRKGWASTLFDHMHRALKKHGIHLTHDTIQTPYGKRWAARQETTRGGSYMPIHRQAQHDAKWEMREKLHKAFPEHKDHHEKMINLANRLLDQAGGYHGKKQHLAYQRASRKLGLPKLGARKVAHLMKTLGGEHEALPKRHGQARPKIPSKKRKKYYYNPGRLTSLDPYTQERLKK